MFPLPSSLVSIGTPALATHGWEATRRAIPRMQQRMITIASNIRRAFQHGATPGFIGPMPASPVNGGPCPNGAVVSITVPTPLAEGGIGQEYLRHHAPIFKAFVQTPIPETAGNALVDTFESCRAFSREVAKAVGATPHMVPRLFQGRVEDGETGETLHSGDPTVGYTAPVATMWGDKPIQVVTPYRELVDLDRLLRRGLPTIALLFTPRSAGASVPGYSYHFVNSLAVIKPKGDIPFQCTMWNHMVPRITVDTRGHHESHRSRGTHRTTLRLEWWRRYVPKYRRLHYTVHPRPLADSNWSAVLFLPCFEEFKYRVPLLLEPHPPSPPFRLYNTTGSLVVMRYRKGISLAETGIPVSVFITNEVWATVLANSASMKNAIMEPTVIQRIASTVDDKTDNGILVSRLLWLYLHYGRLPALEVIQDMVTYKFLFDNPKDELLDSPKPSVHSCGVTPYSLTGSPSDDNASTSVQITERIEKVANPDHPIPKEYLTWADEFTSLVVEQSDGGPGTGVCYSYDDIWDLQTKPAQKAAIMRNLAALAPGPIDLDAFMKKEPYGKIGPPRGITQVDVQNRIALSQFMLAFSSGCMKNCHWYAFGKDPQALAAAMMDLAGRSPEEKLHDCDYSKFDGTKGMIHHLVCKMALMKWVRPKDMNLLASLLEKETNVWVKNKYGQRFWNRYQQISGSSDTSDFNSMANAFEKYCAYRVGGYGSRAAWDALGLYGGDDSLDCSGLKAEWLDKVTAVTGTITKFCTRSRGTPIPLLGRYWPDPWSSGKSTIDVWRQFGKLPCTVSNPKNTPYWTALRRKAQGYMVTDPDTPIIKEWCEAVCRTTASVKPGATPDTGYYASLYPTPESWKGVTCCYAEGMVVADATAPTKAIALSIPAITACLNGVKKFADLDLGDLTGIEPISEYLVLYQGFILKGKAVKKVKTLVPEPRVDPDHGSSTDPPAQLAPGVAAELNRAKTDPVKACALKELIKVQEKAAHVKQVAHLNEPRNRKNRKNRSKDQVKPAAPKGKPRALATAGTDYPNTAESPSRAQAGRNDNIQSDAKPLQKPVRQFEGSDKEKANTPGPGSNETGRRKKARKQARRAVRQADK